MNTICGTLAALCLACNAVAQAPAPTNEEPKSQIISQVSQSAAAEFAKSTQQLNALREQIAKEKLPLAQELTALEEKLSLLRRESETITHDRDEGVLGLSKIKDTIKKQEDTLSYVTGLLDEYARTFETKVNQSELQYCGKSMEAAKEASENTTLPMPEKFERQVAFVNLSVQRLVDAIGGMRFKGVGVDMQGELVEGQFAMIGPVALFRSTSGAAAGLVVPQTGSPNPLIRPLEGPMQASLATLVDTGEGAMPLDPSRGAALKELIQRVNLYHIFEKGGPIMWPLLVASILAFGTVLERVLFLLERFKRDQKALSKFFAAVGRGDMEEAIRISRPSRYFVVRALGYALRHKEQSLESALLYAQGLEMKRFRRGIPILDTVITLAPLLGLLGTVTGMMGSFSIIGGELSSPGAITGGIAEALIATAFGLGIAITSLLPFNFLNARMEEARHQLDSASVQLELLVRQAAITQARESIDAVQLELSSA